MVDACTGRRVTSPRDRDRQHPVAIHRVDAFTDSYDRAEKLARANMLGRHPRYRHVSSDLAELQLEPHLRQVEAIFHLAGRPGGRDSFSPRLEHPLASPARRLDRRPRVAPGRSRDGPAHLACGVSSPIK
jgi:hypothetical protein